LTYTFEYVYDAVGNRTAQTATITSTQVTDYVDDAANRLIAISGQPAAVTSAYNGDGVRLQQIIAGVPTTYTQELAAPLPVVLQSQTNADAMKYVYALGTRPLAQYMADAAE
jgi:hypothetical protein